VIQLRHIITGKFLSAKVEDDDDFVHRISMAASVSADTRFRILSRFEDKQFGQPVMPDSEVAFKHLQTGWFLSISAQILSGGRRDAILSSLNDVAWWITPSFEPAFGVCHFSTRFRVFFVYLTCARRSAMATSFAYSL
jgi:hypothetical protein